MTTIRQPMRQIGEEAVRQLFRRLRESGNLLPRRRVLLEPALVIRQSSRVDGGTAKNLKKRWSRQAQEERRIRIGK